MRADLDGALRRGLDALGAIGPGEPDDAEAGAIALLGMRPRLQNLLAERRRRRADFARVLADALDRPAGIAPMARRHVLGNGRVLAIAARPQMDGDALALAENLDAADGQPRFDLGAGEAVGHGVIMRVDLDVIIDADAAQAPFAIFVGLDRQSLQRRAVDLLEQLAARDAEPADGPLLVEIFQHLADRGVDLRQAVEGPAAQPAEQPALDDQHRRFDLRLVARLSRAAPAAARSRNAPPCRRRCD